MFGNFFLKKMLRMKGVPPEQIDMVVKMMEKDPELFKKIAEEIQVKIKEGKSQETAAMEAMQKYQDQIKNLM